VTVPLVWHERPFKQANARFARENVGDTWVTLLHARRGSWSGLAYWPLLGGAQAFRKPRSAHFGLSRRSLAVGIVICGAGITGISAAYYLARHGISDILLVEKGTPRGSCKGGMTREAL